ncbi:MAG: 23S rRNA (adenine(2503)-C(2))-methyltransferase RlmN [Deltaproteobacteria bacterium]|nr:23S rRNA (adenine(2503)-C(2))-methyltransferase RlmN [Deltaproteobacteria bacterium]MBW2051099.1 23S rRNA (adenine(2503)-C(2))-methyltransferase RlmN [Deltaproteobacteria bacterium]MBW2140296.1 23S rRNA (adenine(2503)-C(2))-methyltransferase RlmN [Deltaproteobacteria bacterium]MBW2322913.1 23S rRNA (adenine(2503)-C(2))-methyltransferase RlmN [Deltaproteobacteria bacterium]
MNQIDLKEMNLEGLEEFIASLGEKPFRARQIRKWLFNAGVNDFEAMTDLSKTLRARIGERARISGITCLKVEESQDGARKYLWELEDKARIESVLIPERDHLTLCISTQVGCAMGCRFCRTATLGLTRNLTQAEIINQILGIKNGLSDKNKLKNIVFMGMGEPLANPENVIRAIKIMLEPGLMQLSHRRMSLSTVGLIPELKRLADQVTVGLTVSLNAADNKIRDYLMPINRRFPLEDLHKALTVFPLPSRRMITIAYVLLADVNDSERHAKQLTRFLSGLRCKVNLVPFNPYPGAQFEAPNEEKVLAFRDALIKKHYTAIIRRSKGREISAACGQLVGSENTKK